MTLEQRVCFFSRPMSSFIEPPLPDPSPWPVDPRIPSVPRVDSAISMWRQTVIPQCGFAPTTTPFVLMPVPVQMCCI